MIIFHEDPKAPQPPPSQKSWGRDSQPHWIDAYGASCRPMVDATVEFDSCIGLHVGPTLVITLRSVQFEY